MVATNCELDKLVTSVALLPALLSRQVQHLLSCLIFGAISALVGGSLANGTCLVPAFRACCDVVLDSLGRDESGAGRPVAVRSVWRFHLGLPGQVFSHQLTAEEDLNLHLRHRDVLSAASGGKQGFVGEGLGEKILETSTTILVPTRESCKVVEGKAFGADHAWANPLWS